MAVIDSRFDRRSQAGAGAVAHGMSQVQVLRERLAHAATGGREAHIRRHRERGKLLVRERIDFIVDDGSAFLELSPLAAGRSLLQCGGRALELTIRGDAQQVELASALGSSVFAAQPYLGDAAGDAAASGQLGAPMMGKVVAVKAAVGETVALGQTVIVLESMKMELHVTAPFEGSVSSLRCRVGDMVERHQVLAEVTAA